MRQSIRKAAPDAVETMSYSMPIFDLNGKHVVFFAGWKHHISLANYLSLELAALKEITQELASLFSLILPISSR